MWTEELKRRTGIVVLWSWNEEVKTESKNVQWNGKQREGADFVNPLSTLALYNKILIILTPNNVKWMYWHVKVSKYYYSRVVLF